MRKVVTVIAAVMCIAISLVSCFSDVKDMLYNAATVQSDMPSQEAISLYGGTWIATTLYSEGYTINMQQIENADDIKIYLVIENDGKAVFHSEDGTVSYEGTWSQSENGISFISGDVINQFVFEDGKLYYYEDDANICFERMSDVKSETASAQQKESDSKDFDCCGTWVASYVYANGITADLSKAGITDADGWYLIIKKGGDAYVNIGGVGGEATWKKSGNSLKLTAGGTVEVFLDDGKLYFEVDDGYRMYFKKTSDSSYESKAEKNIDYSKKVDLRFENYRNIFGAIQAFLILTNNADVPLSIEASIVAYDGSDNKVGAQNGTAYAVSPGGKALLLFYFDDESASRVSYRVESAEKETFFKDVAGKISVESNAAKNKQIATVTNHNNFDVDILTVHCLFYKGGNLVSYSSNIITDLGAGQSSSVELMCFDDYDSCEFYFDGTAF